MRFFIDNNLSVSLAEGMKAFGENVEHLQDHFRPDTPDTEWLEYIGKEGIFLITRDDRIRWNPAERRALLKFRVGAFFLGGKNLDRWSLVQQLVRNWPRIKELAENKNRPFAYRVPPSGSKLRLIHLDHSNH